MTPQHPLVAAARDLARLVVPVACPGCGARDVLWCDDCAAPWWEPPLRSESSAPRLATWDGAPLPVWAIAPLEGSAHSLVVAWKDGGRRDLDVFFCDAMRRQALHVAPALRGLGRVAVVPVPSRRASVARRGADLPAMLARAAAEGLVAGGLQAAMLRVLSIGAGEQRGASARARWRQASSVRLAGPGLARRARTAGAAILVDDVLTTGATMAAAARALDVGLLTVAAGFCLAAAPSLGARRHVTVT